MENSQNDPNNKTRQRKIKDASISLINVGGNVLEKILINRIMHYIFSNNLMNKNQFGFTPRKSSTDATLAVKEYIEEGIKQGYITILISLDVRGAFDAAWWPSVLHALKELNCPKNLYNLASSYFSERTVSLCTNNIRIERQVSKCCPQGSCCDPGFWNIKFNSLLNLKFGKRTKAIAFADELLIAVRAESVIEAENFANTEISRIKNWAKNNKITFNEQKSKVMVVTRRERRENQSLHISEQQTARTGKQYKIPRNHVRQQTELQRAYNIHIQEVHYTNTHTSKIGETKLGTSTRSSQYNIQRSHTTPHVVRRTSLDTSNGEELQQDPIQQSTTTHKHQNIKVIPNDI